MLPGNPEFGDSGEKSIGEPEQATNNVGHQESNKSERFCNKFGKIGKKFAKWAGALLLVGSISEVGNYYRTQNSVEISKDQKGNNVYRHPDPETTHILNYFAGREELRMEEIERNFREQLKFDFITYQDLSVPDDFDSYSIEQIDEWYSSVYPQHKKGAIQRQFTEYVKENILCKITPSEDIYNFVWELEKEAGNPKIRFDSPGIIIDGANYSSLEHTVYIEISRPKSTIFSELAHSKQFRGEDVYQYIKNRLRGLRDAVKAGVRGILGAGISSGMPVIPIWPEYQKLYDEPGSVEYEAHKEIQLDLQAKYKKIINAWKSKK